MPALMYDLADRVGAIFTEQFRKAGYDARSAPIYAHALVGMVAFVGQWWTESAKPPPADVVASHVAALAWMGLRHLPKRPALASGAATPERRPRIGQRGGSSGVCGISGNGGTRGCNVTGGPPAVDGGAAGAAGAAGWAAHAPVAIVAPPW